MKITNKKARQNEFVAKNISLTEIMESGRTSIRFSIQLTAPEAFSCAAGVLISPFTAVTIIALSFPHLQVAFNSATTSCGTRALSCCDCLFFEPVAITGSPCVRCATVYTQKDNKRLDVRFT
jgi:hypothetical protein